MSGRMSTCSPGRGTRGRGHSRCRRGKYLEWNWGWRSERGSSGRQPAPAPGPQADGEGPASLLQVADSNTCPKAYSRSAGCTLSPERAPTHPVFHGRDSLVSWVRQRSASGLATTATASTVSPVPGGSSPTPLARLRSLGPLGYHVVPLERVVGGLL